MPCSMRPSCRVPTQRFITSCGFGNSGVGELVLLVLVTSGCTEWAIPPCAGTPFKTRCVGPCMVDAEPAGPTYTQATMPLAVVTQDTDGKRHGLAIQP